MPAKVGLLSLSRSRLGSGDKAAGKTAIPSCRFPVAPLSSKSQVDIRAGKRAVVQRNEVHVYDVQ
jgi:hypothetical protein